MDRQLTFEILLYLNIYFTIFYGGMEAFFLLMKYIYVPEFGELVKRFHSIQSELNWGACNQAANIQGVQAQYANIDFLESSPLCNRLSDSFQGDRWH